MFAREGGYRDLVSCPVHLRLSDGTLVKVIAWLPMPTPGASIGPGCRADGRAATLLWNDGPRLQELYGALAEEGLHAGPQGKGRGVWLAFGAVLASDRARVIADVPAFIRANTRILEPPHAPEVRLHLADDAVAFGSSGAKTMPATRIE